MRFFNFRKSQARGSKRGFRIPDMTYVRDLGELLESRAELASYPVVSRIPDCELRPTPPLLFPASQEIASDHYMVPSIRDVVMAGMKNVTITENSVIGTEDEILSPGDAVQPMYVSIYLRNGWVPDAETRPGAKKQLKCKGIGVLLTHFNSSVYGHWLYEGLPQLLLLKHLRSELPDLSIVLPSRPQYLSEWCRFLVPDVRIFSYDPRRETVFCEQLLIPGIFHSNSAFMHPFLDVMIEDAVSTATRESERPLPSHIYLTRNKPSHFRQLGNQDEIEQIAKSAGLTLLSPEDYSIPAQIRLFSGAKLVVSEFGSALHNTMFSGPCDIISLNWITCIQSRIAQLRQQNIGYVLPPLGPLTFQRELEQTKREYWIDPEDFRRKLAERLHREPLRVPENDSTSVDFQG
ncbi:MAG: glycosyltransferase family 61 protein [Hyphomicrobium sp.]|nr:MAG: glycosyltransferase family 61 protein [Hyphomicrobium sp.]